jgi:hypothetical protein
MPDADRRDLCADVRRVERVSEAVQERAEQFEEREEQLRARFEAEAD